MDTRHTRWSRPRHFSLSLSFAALVGGFCVASGCFLAPDDPRAGSRGALDAAGRGVATLDLLARDGRTSTFDLTGPASLRPYGQGWVLTLRWLRPTGTGVARGDLRIVGTDPRRVGSAQRMQVAATYIERGGSENVSLSGEGRMAVSLPITGNVAAFDVVLKAGSGGQPIQELRVRGAFTADRVVGFTPLLSGIGAWVWWDPFDPFLVWAQSDLDFVEYVEAHPDDAAWATESYDGAQYGFVDAGGAYHGPDGEGWEDGSYGSGGDPGGDVGGGGDWGGDTGGDWGGDSGGDSGGDW